MPRVLVLYYSSHGHIELAGKRFQGKLAAETAKTLFG